MANLTEIKVPDIGDYADVPIIDLFVKVGDSIAVDDAICTLESDKATMDVPASAAGVVKELLVKLGDRVAEGTVLIRIDAAAGAAKAPADAPASLPTAQHEHDSRLSQYRAPFDALMLRAIGRTTHRVRYDWRRSTLQLGAHIGLPAELNNFDSLRWGGQLRWATADLLLSVDLSIVRVRDNTSSRLLALTPYRQPGRPSRPTPRRPSRRRARG